MRVPAPAADLESQGSRKTVPWVSEGHSGPRRPRLTTPGEPPREGSNLPGLGELGAVPPAGDRGLCWNWGPHLLFRYVVGGQATATVQWSEATSFTEKVFTEKVFSVSYLRQLSTSDTLRGSCVLILLY